MVSGTTMEKWPLKCSLISGRLHETRAGGQSLAAEFRYRQMGSFFMSRNLVTMSHIYLFSKFNGNLKCLIQENRDFSPEHVKHQFGLLLRNFFHSLSITSLTLFSCSAP